MEKSDMSDMRKLMEAVELNEFDMEASEAVHELEDIKQQIANLLDEAKQVLRSVGNEGVSERARRTWLAHMTTALSNDHEWMGRDMNTMQDTIEELYQMNDESGEEY
jgi:ElaB/YqjD/DUF883 family membrane-anchored ribosome-binding protein